MEAYKTLFIETERKIVELSGIIEVNGDHTARLIQAAIIEKVMEGYELIGTETLNSTHATYSYSEGVLLFFKLKEK